MNIFQEIKDRWVADTPVFFQKIKAISIAIGTPAMSIWVANSSFSLGLNGTLLDVCKYTIAVAASLGLTSQLTKANP